MEAGVACVEGAIARLRVALAAEPDLQLVVLFGSASVGRARGSSDLDVAILPTNGRDGQARDFDDLSLQTRLTLAARREVDLVRIDEASTLLKWEIAKAGVALLEARPGEMARFRARATSEYIDFLPSFQHHAEVFRRRLIQQGQSR